MKLATHQNKAYNVVMDYISMGIKEILVVSPTGSGKTVIFGDLIKKLIESGGKVIVLTDRTSLLEQTGRRFFEQFEINATYIKSGSPIIQVDEEGSDFKVFVGMVETLNNRLLSPVWSGFFSGFDYIIIDEAHEQVFRKVIENKAFATATKIGFTATPVYSSRSKCMADDYKVMSVIASENELIQDGRLVMPHTIVNEIDLSMIKTRMGEYSSKSQKETAKHFLPAEKVVDIYKANCREYVHMMKMSGNEHWEEYEGKNLKAIYFGIDSNHCIELYNEFDRQGVSAGFILSDSKIQSRKEREEVERAFANNEITVLVNCQIATKGFDVSDILIVGKVFKTKSLAKDNQTSGRGSRPLLDGLHYIDNQEDRRNALSKSKKPFFFIIDYFGNFEEHGYWNSYKDWRGYFEGNHLKKASKRESIESSKGCPKCGNSVSPRASECLSMVLNPDTIKVEVCGFKFPKEDAKAIEKQGDYKLADKEALNLTIEQLRGKDVFQIFEIYKAKNCSFKDALKCINSDVDKYIFADLMKYKDIAGWFSNYYRRSIQQDSERLAKIKVLDIAYELSKLAEIPDSVEKMDAIIFKENGNSLIQNAYEAIKMFK